MQKKAAKILVLASFCFLLSISGEFHPARAVLPANTSCSGQFDFRGDLGSGGILINITATTQSGWIRSQTYSIEVDYTLVSWQDTGTTQINITGIDVLPEVFSNENSTGSLTGINDVFTPSSSSTVTEHVDVVCSDYPFDLINLRIDTDYADYVPSNFQGFQWQTGTMELSPLIVTPAESISVASPVDSSTMVKGGTCSISWTYIGPTTSVNVDLFQGTTLVQNLAWHIATPNTGTPGTYSWAIPSNFTSGTYRINVSNAADSSVSVFSGTFAIQDPSSSAPSSSSSAPPGPSIASPNVTLIMGMMLAASIAIMMKKKLWRGPTTRSSGALVNLEICPNLGHAGHCEPCADHPGDNILYRRDNNV